MRVAVIGTGYVGLVTGTCFSDMGNEVWCVDVDRAKIERLKRGEIPIYEPGLSEMVKKNHESGALNFTTEIGEALKRCNICFIAVGTPMGEDGSADLQYVLAVAKSIGQVMERHTYVVDKSTVPVGFTKAVSEKYPEAKILFSPEFLRESKALYDNLYPSRIIVGSPERPSGAAPLREAAERFAGLLKEASLRPDVPVLLMGSTEAEAVKLFANTYLALRVSYFNELDTYAEMKGLDTQATACPRMPNSSWPTMPTCRRT